MDKTGTKGLTSGRLLVKNVMWNFFIQGMPVIIAVFTIPLIIKGMGIERFSILTLAWAVIGYSSLFDLGLGRALTLLVSRKLGRGDTADLPVVVWTGLAIISALGILAGFLIYFSSPYIVKLLNVPDLYQIEALDTMHLLALSLPFLIAIMSLKGILESFQKFAVISLLRLPVIFCNYVGPLLVFPFTNNLFYIVLVLVIGRILTFFGYFYFVSGTIDNFYSQIGFEKKYFRALIRFGGWLTISNIVSPMMIYMDRFFIAGMITSSVVAYYTTPYDVITKMWIIPTAIMSVIFPALGHEFARDRARATKLYFRSMNYTALVLIIPVILVLLFGKWGLSIWLNPDFAEKSFLIAQILTVGAFFYSLNLTSYGVIQALGRADVTAKVHLFELPLYLVYLFFLIKEFGIIGAPLAWVGRIIIDSILMHSIAVNYLKGK